MSQSQLQALHELLRHSPLDFGADVVEMRAVFHELISHRALAPDVRTGKAVLGGVLCLEVAAGERTGPGTLLYFHGGAYAVGSAADSVGLVSDISRRAGALAYTVEYRLAPENPYPAAVDDALAAYRGLVAAGVDPASVAVVGESAGGGLAVALLLRIRDARLPMPACAAVLSPWADMTMSSSSLAGKDQVDPALSADALEVRARSYLAGTDPAVPCASPALADLRGLPPLLIQVGSAEILLDDAVRLAARAASDDVAVTLEVVPGAPHVFQGFAGALDEADAALDRVGAFLCAQLGARPEAPVPAGVR